MNAVTKKCLARAAGTSKHPLGVLAAQAVRGHAVDPSILEEKIKAAGFTIRYEERRNNMGAACAILKGDAEVGLGRDETRLDALMQAVAGELRGEIGVPAWVELSKG